MGVRGLLSFLRQRHADSWLHVTLNGSHVVMDGDNFLSYILSRGAVDWRLGGDYPLIFAAVLDFLNTLASFDITVTVVFDA